MTKRVKKILTGSLMISVLVAFVFIASPKVSSAQRTIVIDPGHGSAVNKRDYEGTRELAIGLKLKADLEQKGYKVVMTHSSIGTAIGGVGSGSSEKQDNIARANIANNNQTDLTIRLHSDDRSDDRFVILYPDKPAKDPYGFSGPQSTAIIPESKSAALAVQSALSKSGYSGSAVGETTGFKNGGMIQTFSAHSSYPGITLELYGHNSSALRDKYASSSEQDKVAKALAEGINTYLGGSSASSAQSGISPTAATGERLANADPRCPTQAPSPGPSSGEDYQQLIAHQINVRNDQNNKSATASSNGPLPEVSNNIAKVAEGEVGYAGQLCPNGKHDKTKYDACNQWCAYFVTWVFKQAGFPMPSIGSSREVYNWMKSNGHSTFNDPSKTGEGDLIVWQRDSRTGHVGIIVKNDIQNKNLTIVEGNTTHDIVKANIYSYASAIDRGDGLTLLGFARW